jgi:uncharacterized protein (DUF2249 family)
MKIDAHTKISALIKHHPGAIDTLVSISSKFTKLRNPVLRKLLAPRATISMAAGIAGCSVQEFFQKLSPLGFQYQEEAPASHPGKARKQVKTVFSRVVDLDVRGLLNSDRDPLPNIMKGIRQLKRGEALKIINSFEPRPLVELLNKQGYESYSERADADLFHTYFYHAETRKGNEISKPGKNLAASWDEVLENYKGRMESLDVRRMEMPAPMISILEKLEELDKGKALFVYHKRVPQFLLPELDSRNFSYLFKVIGENEVNLLIYPREGDAGAD